MKQPRISDFDPKAREHGLNSSMEDFPAIEQPKPVESANRVQEPVLPVRPVRDVPSVSPSRRKIKSRHPYDLYEDQIEELRKLSLEDQMRGVKGSQSAMAREAIDDYIAKRRAGQ